MSYVQKLIACRPAHSIIRYGGRNLSLGAARSYSTRPSSKRSSRTAWLLFGLTGVVGIEVGLILKSHNDKEFKQWLNDYVPWWAWYVDEYGSPFIEWTKQNFFQRGKEPLSSNRPASITKPPLVEEPKDAKPQSNTKPTNAKAKSSASDPQPTPTAVQNQATATVYDGKPLNTKGHVKEETKLAELTKAVGVNDENLAKKSSVEKSERKKESERSTEKPIETGKTVEQNSDGHAILAKIESNLANCLKEFTTTCGSMIESNLLLADSMEKARYNMAKELLKKTEDGALSEMKKSAEDAATSLKVKVEESYPSYCAAHQELLAVVSEATSAGLSSLVSEAEFRIFELISLIKSSEDAVRKNKIINDAFDSFRNTLKSAEDEMGQELAELEKTTFIDPSVVESVVLHLAERKVQLLHDKIQQLSVDDGKKLEESLQQYREDLVKTFEAKMLRAMKESRADMQARMEAKLEEARKKFEFELLEQLRRQALIHGENLTYALEEQAVDLEKKWTEDAKQKMAAQAEHYQSEVAAMYGKLAGIESTIDAVAKASHEARLQQGLHTACDNLFKALVLANECLESDKQHNFKKEIAGVMEVAGHDEMVSQLLESIPKEAIFKGIYSEEVLKERFYRVKRICSRVSLVPLEGAGLGTYAISYLRSLLIFTTKTVPLNCDPSELDTMGLLQVASAHLAAGDLEMTARMMNQLQGEAGRVASDWINDVRVYLQTKQAISTLADYTAAAGISLLK